MYDLVAIGGGSAGLVSAAVAAGLGARTALIEKDRLGGECLWTGCVPSKALIHAAGIAHAINTAAGVGLSVSPVTREAAVGVMERVRSRRIELREADGVEPMLRELGVEFLNGNGEFRSRTEFDLNGTVIRSRRWVLTTGSRPAIPSIPGLAEAGYLTNTTVWDLPQVPASLVILGGGPVGVEMAQAFQRLGARVTLLQRGPRLLVRDDEELVTSLTERLRSEGIDLRTNCAMSRVERVGSLRRVQIGSTCDECVEAEELLIAAGRLPNVEGLGLETVGVKMGRNGIRVDAGFRTTAPNIWACGDVIDGPRFSHAAEYEAKIAVQNALLPFPARGNLERMPWATFTDPELASVGMTEAEARGRGLSVEVFRHPFSRDDRAIVDGQAEGMVKIVARAGGGRLLGVQILGPRAGELIQEAILALDRGLSVRHLADTIHVYPTLSVAVQRAAQYWWKARSDAPLVRTLLNRYFAIRRKSPW